MDQVLEVILTGVMLSQTPVATEFAPAGTTLSINHRPATEFMKWDRRGIWHPRQFRTAILHP
jgi:hypothetical protein